MVTGFRETTRGCPRSPASPGSGAWADAGEPRIIGFDGLRALAFLMVFVSHKAPSPRTEALGSAGVWLFFVLSGFLIVRILAAARARIEAGTATPLDSLQVFYRNRFARIVPVYYAFLFVLYATRWAARWISAMRGSSAQPGCI